MVVSITRGQPGRSGLLATCCAGTASGASEQWPWQQAAQAAAHLLLLQHTPRQCTLFIWPYQHVGAGPASLPMATWRATWPRHQQTLRLPSPSTRLTGRLSTAHRVRASGACWPRGSCCWFECSTVSHHTLPAHLTPLRCAPRPVPASSGRGAGNLGRAQHVAGAAGGPHLPHRPRVQRAVQVGCLGGGPRQPGQAGGPEVVRMQAVVCT